MASLQRAFSLGSVRPDVQRGKACGKRSLFPSVSYRIFMRLRAECSESYRPERWLLVLRSLQQPLPQSTGSLSLSCTTCVPSETKG